MNLEYEYDNMILKVLDSSYAAQVLSFCTKNKEQFEPYEIDKPDIFYTLEFQKRILEAEYGGFLVRNFVRFYLFDKTDLQTIIGTVSFSDMKRSAFFSCQTGYKVDSDYTNHGYGFQMLSHAIGIMEKEFHMHRISAYIYPENQPSIKLVEKLGFELEGIAKSYVLMHGKWIDHLNYVYISTQTQF